MVEPLHQLVSLVAQVGFHLVKAVLALLASETLGETLVAAIRAHRHHPGRRQPVRRRIVNGVVALGPARIGVDSLALCLGQADAPGRVPAADTDGHNTANTLRVHSRPFKGLHATK